MDTKKRGAIYCRISLKDKNIPKVERQEAMCRKLADANDIEITKVYVDDGISASTFKDRPGWADLLSDAEAGKFDVLLAQSEDRFTRQVMEKENLQLACAASGVTWLTANDGRTDPATADGEFFSTLRAGLARMEARRKGERQRQAAEARRLNGEPPTGGDKRPFGYEEDKITVRESEAELIRQAYAGVINGTLTPTKIARIWSKVEKVPTSRGGTWTTAAVAALLHRPRNAGIVTYTPETVVNGKKRKGETVRVLDGEGNPVKAQWTPIVSEDTFLAATKILDSRDGKLERAHEPKWLCSGLVTCASCDSPLSSNTNARGVKYRCRVHNGEAPRRTPTGKHVEIVGSILDEAVSAAAVKAVLYAPTSKVSDADTERIGELRRRLADVRRAEANLLELVESGAFRAAEIAAKKRAYVEEAEQIEEQIASIHASNAKSALLADVQGLLSRQTSLEDAAQAQKEIRARFDAMDLEQRRALVAGMLNVEVTAGGRGADRVNVTHKVATSLNEPEPYMDEAI